MTVFISAVQYRLQEQFQRQFFLFWHCTQLQIGTCTTHHYTPALHTNVYNTFSCQDKQIYLRYKLQVNFLSTLTLWTIKEIHMKF